MLKLFIILVIREQKGIRLTFASDGCWSHMSREHAHIIPQWQKHAKDGLHEYFCAAAWQIRAAHTAREQRIAAEHDVMLRQIKAHMAGRMPWGVERFNRQRPNGKGFTRLLDKAIRHSRLRHIL